MRITRFILALLAVGAAVTGCEPGSITEARDELQDGPARTLQLSIPVARDTFYVDSVLTDFLGVTTITIADNLLAVEVTEGSFGLDVGGFTGPVSGVAFGPATFPVQEGVEFVGTDLNLGEFEDAARDASVNTAFAVVTAVNQADVPATLTNFSVGVVRIDPATGYLDSLAGQPDWQTDGGGTPIRAVLAGGTFDIPPSGTAEDTLFSAALVDRLVDMLLDGERVALVGAGDVTVGDGVYVASIGATDQVMVTLKPVIGFDFTLPPGGVSVDSSTTRDGLDLDADNANDIVARLDSAVATLVVENGTPFGVEAFIVVVADSVDDAFSAPAQAQAALDTVRVSPAAVDANGRATQPTTDTSAVNLSGNEVRMFLGPVFTAGIRLRLLPPAGGRGAIRVSDRIGVNAGIAVYVRTGGSP